MRHFLFAIACTFALTTAVHARCGGGGVEFSPAADAELVERPLVLIRGFGQDQGMVWTLKGASLRAGKHVVELERVATHEGWFALTQGAFRAKSPLKAGRKYTLWLHGKHRTWRPTRWRDGQKGFVVWRGSTESMETPRWAGKPTAGEVRRISYGCGPAIHQEVDLPVAGAGLVRVELQGPGGARSFVMSLPKKGPLALGHGMCSGEFEVGPAGTYTATFQLLDASGEAHGQPQSVTFERAGLR